VDEHGRLALDDLAEQLDDLANRGCIADDLGERMRVRGRCDDRGLRALDGGRRGPDEIGVAAPPDGRKLKMILKDDTGARTEERMVQIEPGQRLVVKW